MVIKDVFLLGLLVFIPISIAAHFFHWGDLAVFITSGLAIIPLAAWIGVATEEIATITNPSIGGFLNATFGNATELIISLVALNAGLMEVVKASLTGSIISNLLFVTGFAMLMGGLRYQEQQFQPIVAQMNASAMNLAVIAILLPTAANFISGGIAQPKLQLLSSSVAVVLILVYILMLLFSMRTHTYLYEVGLAEMNPDEIAEVELLPSNSGRKINLWLWIGVLLVTTIFVAIESELLVSVFRAATSDLGLTSLFTGVIVLPIIGNAAEHATAVTVAIKNKMDLSISIAVGSSLQIALFVAPISVLIGLLIGKPMDLNFNPFELVAVAVAVLVANSICADGRSNWLEGILLLATYALLGMTFYFYPAK